MAKFEGHPGHGGFIEVPQREIAEADQGQHGSCQAEPAMRSTVLRQELSRSTWGPSSHQKLSMVRVFRMQWRGRGEHFLREVSTIPKALPAFTILQEEVSMSSSCLTQGLLIAENAG